MTSSNNNLKKKLLTSDNLIFTFLRSGVASQVSSWTDLGLGFVLFAWCGFSPFYATAAGAIAGGVVNCIINYRFTYHASDCPWKAVIVKYIMVWLGSMLLNSYGTELLYNLLNKWTWLEQIGFRPDGYFAAARLSVSLAVSWFWNFLLQRRFVYRPRGFDRYAIAFVDFIFPVKRKNKADKETELESNTEDNK